LIEPLYFYEIIFLIIVLIEFKIDRNMRYGNYKKRFWT